MARCRQFLADRDDLAASRAAAAISKALQLLTTAPAIGRPIGTEPEFRESVIAFGSSGYVALYRYDTIDDEVVILALRHQREAGYY